MAEYYVLDCTCGVSFAAVFADDDATLQKVVKCGSCDEQHLAVRARTAEEA